MTLTRKLAVLGMLGLIVGLVTFAAPSRSSAAENPQVVRITASKFHFTPDRITLAKGKPVVLQLSSTDRTHGFMVKPLGIDTDIDPGKTTLITIRPVKAGTYTTICDHYCGLGHNSMKMTIVVR
jgi:cytochrome c oxidase subunit 2